MAKPNKDGWIRHRGGKCPLPLGVHVMIRWRHGGVFSITITDFDHDPGNAIWQHMPNEPQSDIMAYKLLEAPLWR